MHTPTAAPPCCAHTARSHYARQEFRKAMRALGLSGYTKEVDDLFDSFDFDLSGSIS